MEKKIYKMVKFGDNAFQNKFEPESLRRKHVKQNWEFKLSCKKNNLLLEHISPIVYKT